MWYEASLLQDILKADLAREEDDIFNEINILRSDLENIELRCDDKKAQIDHLNDLLNSLRNQLHQADEQLRDLSQKLRST